MSFALANFVKRSYQLYRPYFGLRKHYFWHTLSGLAILACNVLLAIIFSFFNASMNAMIGVLEQPGVTYSLFFGSMISIGGYLVLNILFTIVKGRLINFLKWSLLHSMDEDIINRWIKNKAFYGIKFLTDHNKNSHSDMAEEINPAQIMSHDSSELLNLLMGLGDDFLTKLCHSVAGVIGLYILSQPLNLVLFSLHITVPGYLLMSTFIYAILYNLITSKIGKSLRKNELAIRHAKGHLYHQSHQIIENAESIAFLKGMEFELQALKSTLYNKHLLRNIAANIKLALSVVTKIYYELSLLVPLTLSVPQIILQKARVSSVFEILPSFQAVLRMITWHNENYESLTLGEVSLTRLERFKALLAAWEEEVKMLEDKKIVHAKATTPTTVIQFQRISIDKPNGDPLLTNIQFTLEKGKVALLLAHSGVGKTTLLRAIADLWPYLREGGKVVFPTSAFEAHFIPQVGFVHHRGATLLETILYPSKGSPKPKVIRDIKAMMEKVNLKQEIIDDLCKIDDWKNRLSAGEKQRIAIISAIVKNPHILFMDEATSALDEKTKEKVERLLKAKLPHAAIALIDHAKKSLSEQVGEASRFIDKEIKLHQFQEKPTKSLTAGIR